MILGLVVIGAIALYVMGTYNGLVTLRTRIQASIQEIGNQMKRQADLIPNLEESAKGYLKHEKDLFKMLTDARKAVQAAVGTGDTQKMLDAGQQISNLLPKMQVVLESNPQIQGAGVVTQLMNELRDTSDKVMYARRTLIDLTADYNIRLVSFPSNLIANMFSFKAEKGLVTPVDGEHLEVTAEDVKTPKVSL